MSRASLTRALRPGARVLLDSTTLIAYLDGGESVSAASALVIDEFVRNGRNPAVISMVAVAEVLVKPAQRSLPGFRHAVDFLSAFPNFTLQPIDLPVAQEAASVRANGNLKMPDALIVATGVVTQVGLLVCNDERWRNIPDRRITPVILGDHIPL